jgi:hypothetical protein
MSKKRIFHAPSNRGFFLRYKSFNYVAGGQLKEDRLLREPAPHPGEMLKLKNALRDF